MNIKDIQRALAQPNFDSAAAQMKMSPSYRGVLMQKKQAPPRLGGVLALLFCRDEKLNVVLTRRHDELTNHAGQISFPGGKHDPPESLEQTALRETHEEVGIAETAVTVIGSLSSLYIPPSNFEVHPFVGWCHGGKRPFFQPNEGEVAEILETPLHYLADPQNRGIETRQFRDKTVRVPYFNVQGYQVWGATAMILNELLERMGTIDSGLVDIK